MKKLFLALAGSVGAIPGIAILQSGLGTPPDDRILFGGVVEAFGAMSLLLLWVNRSRLALLPKMRTTRLSVYLIIACFAFIVIYISLFGFTVVKDDIRGTIYYPLWTTGDMAMMITSANNSRHYAIEKYGIDDVNEAIHKMPSWPLAVTTSVLLLIYQAVFSTLTMAFGMLAIREKTDL